MLVIFNEEKKDNRFDLCYLFCNMHIFYRKFNCLTCHDRNETNEAHQDVGKYRYQNNKCFKCHPMGEIE